jgi:hypothetical protein
LRFALVAGIATAVASVSSLRAEPPAQFGGFYFGLNAGAAWGQSGFWTNPNCPPTLVEASFLQCRTRCDRGERHRRGNERQRKAVA